MLEIGRPTEGKEVNLTESTEILEEVLVYIYPDPVPEIELEFPESLAVIRTLHKYQVSPGDLVLPPTCQKGKHEGQAPSRMKFTSADTNDFLWSSSVRFGVALKQSDPHSIFIVLTIWGKRRHP